MKKALSTGFKRKEQYVKVIRPDVNPINIQAIIPKVLPYKYTLFYPANSMVFKNHKELIYALHELDKSGQDQSSIGLYLTIEEDEDLELKKLIHTFNLKARVHFIGALSYEEVLVYYKSCTTVVFPSYIESFGLPLVEARLFAKPLVVLNTEYARELVLDYEGVFFAEQNNPESWGRALLSSFTISHKIDASTSYHASNWSDFFELMHAEI
jgi:glycosyltransferase involved in cell wall biosynthesis